jgi:hypothetical protein
VDLPGRDTRPVKHERLISQSLGGVGELVVDVTERLGAGVPELVVGHPAGGGVQVAMKPVPASPRSRWVWLV